MAWGNEVKALAVNLKGGWTGQHSKGEAAGSQGI